jgi:hypothetical protein
MPIPGEQPQAADRLERTARPDADDAPSADMMHRYGYGRQAIYRQRRKMGISLRSSGNSR